MDLRKDVEKRMRELGWSRPELVKRLQGQVGKSTIHAFLAGDSHVTSEKLSLILTAMGTWTIVWIPDNFQRHERARYMRELRKSYRESAQRRSASGSD